MTTSSIHAQLPSSSLSVHDGTQWVQFWTSRKPTLVWHDPVLAHRITWRTGLAGIQWGELSLAGSGEAWRTRLVVVRFWAKDVVLRLDSAYRDGEPEWSLARLSDSVLFAVNAGQFEATMPWGWVVLDGRQWLSPQRGPLSAVLAQDSGGTLHWVRNANLASFAVTRPALRWAFQSYPVLLQSDTVLPALRGPGHGIDVGHRDARAAICLDQSGRVIVALTRFDALGTGLGFVPFGLTTPEMAGVMGALGCRDAMLLDGGISAQLRVRDRDSVHDWYGVRHVPLALVALPK
jgi:uncharacterized protein YigE (DUF2233 family)